MSAITRTDAKSQAPQESKLKEVGKWAAAGIGAGATFKFGGDLVSFAEHGVQAAWEAAEVSAAAAAPIAEETSAFTAAAGVGAPAVVAAAGPILRAVALPVAVAGAIYNAFDVVDSYRECRFHSNLSTRFNEDSQTMQDPSRSEEERQAAADRYEADEREFVEHMQTHHQSDNSSCTVQ